MRSIQINDIVEIKTIERTGRVVNIIGESYEVQIGKAFFVFNKKLLQPEQGMGTFLRSLI